MSGEAVHRKCLREWFEVLPVLGRILVNVELDGVALQVGLEGGVNAILALVDGKHVFSPPTVGVACSMPQN